LIELLELSSLARSHPYRGNEIALSRELSRLLIGHFLLHDSSPVEVYHRSKSQARAIQWPTRSLARKLRSTPSVLPTSRSFVRNKRGIAGTLIWINFDRHRLLKLVHMRDKYIANVD